MEQRKIKFDGGGNAYTTNNRNEVISPNKAQVSLKESNLYASKEFVAFFAYNTKMLATLRKYAVNKKLHDEIPFVDGLNVYRIVDDTTNKILLSLIFKFEHHGILRSKYVLNVSGIITKEGFKPQYCTDIRTHIKKSRLLLLQDPVIIETKCVIDIQTNI